MSSAEMLLREDQGTAGCNLGQDGPPAARTALRLPPDFDVVRQQPPVNGFGGVSHEGASFKAGLLQEPGKSPTMIQVEAGRKKTSYEIKEETRGGGQRPRPGWTGGSPEDTDWLMSSRSISAGSIRSM